MNEITLFHLEFDPPSFRVDTQEKYEFLMECLEVTALELLEQRPDELILVTYRLWK